VPGERRTQKRMGLISIIWRRYLLIEPRSWPVRYGRKNIPDLETEIKHSYVGLDSCEIPFVGWQEGHCDQTTHGWVSLGKEMDYVFQCALYPEDSGQAVNGMRKI
jgi:hypothetical protein